MLDKDLKLKQKPGFGHDPSSGSSNSVRTSQISVSRESDYFTDEDSSHRRSQKLSKNDQLQQNQNTGGSPILQMAGQMTTADALLNLQKQSDNNMSDDFGDETV